MSKAKCMGLVVAGTAFCACAAERVRLVAIADYCTTNGMTCAKETMVRAIEKAGFAAYIVPYTEDEAKLEALLAGADALMIGGGVGKLQDYERRCTFERRAIRIAEGRKIPISGICHGSQVVNLYFGGSISPTPVDAVPQIVHTKAQPATTNLHSIDILPGSLVAKALGAEKYQVNSSHTKRSDEIGKGLHVTAWAPDGVVEALEHESLPIAVFQFHPEYLADHDVRFSELLRLALSPRK